MSRAENLHEWRPPNADWRTAMFAAMVSLVLDDKEEPIVFLRVGAVISGCFAALLALSSFFGRHTMLVTRLVPHLTNVLLAAVVFGLTFTEPVRRYWEIVTLVVIALMVTSYAIIAANTHHMLPLFAVVILFPIGAAFLPWSVYWQMLTDVICLGIFAIGDWSRFGDSVDPYRWTVLVTVASLGFLSVLMRDQYRRRLRVQLGGLIGDLQRQRAIFDSVPDGLVLLSAQGMVIDVNPAAMSLVGLADARSGLGRSIYELIPAEATDQVVAALGRVLEAQRTRLDFKLSEGRFSGHVYEVEARLLRDPNSDSPIVLAHIHDRGPAGGTLPDSG